ncbi:methylmalonyl-CoA mutase subunit beta [Neptunitalea lumnitzerae]|uniref:Methylmalonyl-CoA mutase n=1 Tax=Neptunitalea lumnitzerae TaxID=2965509 RepID=A0ABQ5MMK9_9FLAO|nr:methylmalonyl-CoA mutase subunit beta [Neptunitalea sp. Y10]GLB50330.1 methylmalonyl-CoA mutase [Neptunitalea sp. Y10]
MNKQLFDDFSEVSAKQWKQKIQFDLKGKDYNETLIWKTTEGIDVKPFYTDEDTQDTFKAPVNNEQWLINQKVYAGDEKIAAKLALDYIARGAESIRFEIPSDSTHLDVLLKDFPFETTPVYLYFHFLSQQFIEEAQAFLSAKNAKGYMVLDIIGNLAETGNWYQSLTEDHEVLENALAHQQSFPLAVGIDTSIYQNAGANCTQQLAYAMGHVNEYLNHLQNKPYFKELTFVFDVAVGTNYFFEISKLKALRTLWNTLSDAYEITNNCFIYATPTKRNKTIYDYNVNMLRTTTECMSAILGGADAVANMPYDGLFHKENEFGNRIARNQLLILKHESYFNLVNNPTEGTYYIESITKQLAEKALAVFKSIEAGGGFLAQLKSHIIQKKIKESAAEEQALFDANELVAIGTNKYPNPQDVMKNDLQLYPFVKTDVKKTLIEPIFGKRLSEALEKERLAEEKQ